MAVSLEDQLKAAQREVAMRRGVYPRWVASGRMTAKKAADETSAMEAIVETLQRLVQADRLI